MPGKKPLAFHPFLFALYPVLFFYDINKHEIEFAETWMPMGIVLAATGLLLILIGFLLREMAGIFTSCCLIVFFFYEAILKKVSGSALGNLILSLDPELLGSYGILLVLLFIGIKTRKGPLHGFTRFLNIVSVVLIIFPLANSALYKLKIPGVSLEQFASVKKDTQGDIDAVGSKPDIYYIILDAYVREDILKGLYGYDNRAFIDFLQDRGFQVAHKSRSNYPVTLPSLTSSLNMNYVEQLVPQADREKRNLLLLNRLMEDNEVVRFLKSLGYRYIHFSSGANLTKSNRNADLNEAPPNQLTPFAEYLINKTFLKAFGLSYFDPIHIKRKTVLHAFDKLEEMPGIKEPTFVFAHMLMPHGPYVFDKDGNVPANPGPLNGYLDQLAFTNKKIMQVIDKILSASDVPPIIILQADHGGEFKSQCIQPDVILLKEKMSILNAYYLPEKEDPYESITPVNSFRFLFDQYFGTSLGLLEDKSYFTFCYEQIFQPVLTPDEKFMDIDADEPSIAVKKWIQSLEEAIQKFPDFPQAHNTLGFQYYRLSRYPEAKEHFRKAVQLDPLFFNPHYNLGLMYKNLEDYQNAGKELESAIKLAPWNPSTHNELGIIANKLNQPEQAIEYFFKAVEIDPNYAIGYFNLGMAHAMLNFEEKARAFLEKAVQIDPSLVEAHNGLGVLLKNQKRYPEALAQFEAVVRLAPLDPQVHRNLAETFLASRQYGKAIGPLKESLRLDPNAFELRGTLGWVYTNLNRHPEAIEQYRMALKINPQDAKTHGYLGKAYDMIKDGKSAIQHTRMAKQLYLEKNETAAVSKASESLQMLFNKYPFNQADFGGEL